MPKPGRPEQTARRTPAARAFSRAGQTRPWTTPPAPTSVPSTSMHASLTNGRGTHPLRRRRRDPPGVLADDHVHDTVRHTHDAVRPCPPERRLVHVVHVVQYDAQPRDRDGFDYLDVLRATQRRDDIRRPGAML